MPNTPEGKERITRIETEIPHIEHELEALRTEVEKAKDTYDMRLRKIEEWRRSCTYAAGWWGTVLMGAVALGAWVVSSWENIKNIITGAK